MSAAGESLVLTRELWEQYLNSLELSKRKTQTIMVYRRCMEELYDYLPEGKEINEGTLNGWKKYLKEKGYSESAVNQRMTAANGLVKYCGMREYTISRDRVFRDAELPKLTRSEYLRFLFEVSKNGTEQEYLLIKLLASVDIRIRELQCLTVESCREGRMYMPDGRMSIIPPCMGRELTDYAERRGIASGPVFVTRSGNSLDRSNISRAIRQLAVDAGIEPEKCSPSALHRVYRTTQEELKAKILPIYVQTYDNMLNTEQALVAWR